MGKLLGNLSMAIRHIAILGDDSEFQRYHTNQACYKLGIMPPEYQSVADGNERSGDAVW
jgi:hypothetical protein